MSTALIQR